MDDNDIINDFIHNSSDEENNSKNQNVNRYNIPKKDFQNQNEEENIEIKAPEISEEKKRKIKLFQLRNELLMSQIKKKEKLLKDFKVKCVEQANKINNLKKQVTELMAKQNYSSNINNNKFESNKKYKPKKENKKIDIKKNTLIDQIETIKYNIDDTTFFQCGICMDTFVENEKIKKLPCDHIFHTECMSQWIQTQKTCPFCAQAIFY